MSSCVLMVGDQTAPTAALNQSCWYAVQTRSKHEKRAAAELQEKGITAYLPLLAQVHHWSDRRKIVQVPLFPGYLFVRIQLESRIRLSVLQVWGVLNFVGSQREILPVSDSEIDDIESLVSKKIPLTPYPFLKVGQRVRVRGGALEGLEGILVTNGEKRLVISVGAINRSLSISLEGYDVEPA